METTISTAVTFRQMSTDMGRIATIILTTTDEH